MEITIPYNFTPRKYQIDAYNSLARGYKRGFLVFHRRAGKDKLCFNLMAKEAFRVVGTYAYFLPTYNQGRKVIWDGIDNDGFRFIDHLPEVVRDGLNGHEMKIQLKNGSIIQVIGTDNYDNVRGMNLRGAVFSEYAFQNPMAWEVVRPILAANDGWAIFNTTPNGKNHAYKLFQEAQENERWFSQVLTVEDTGVVPEDVLDDERRSMSREMFLQEYFCSFDVGMVGSVYGEQLESVPTESLPVYPERGLFVVADIGISDSTALWFFQKDGNFLNAIHYYENRGKQAHHYYQYIQDFADRKSVMLEKLVLPHDSKKRSLVSSDTVLSQAQDFFGGHKVHYQPIGSVQGRIQTTRTMMPRMRIDGVACSLGLDALQNYKFHYDEKKKSYSKDPEHNWASHGCLVGDTKVKTKEGDKKIKDVVIGDYVWTPKGYMRVLNSGMTKIAKKLIEIETSNGSKIIATPEHKFFTNKGIAKADTLRYDDSIWTKDINHRLLFLRGLNTNFRDAIMSPHLALGKFIVTYTGHFGQTLMEKFQKNIMSIIKMETVMTTGLKILSVLTPLPIYLNTQRIANGTSQDKMLLPFLQKQYQKPLSGTNQKKAGSGTKNTEKRHGKKESLLKKLVRYVGKNISLSGLLNQDSATRIVRLRRLEEEEPVYDLTVEKHHCYLANGLLVSNSDAFGYSAEYFSANNPIVKKPVKVYRQNSDRMMFSGY